MASPRRRVAIVGAGPSGCALATFCARAGHEVTIFDKDESPQAVVGESLLPYGNRVLSMLDVPMGTYQIKTGAVFVRGAQRVRYDFEEAERPTWTTAHQVPRADFDRQLRRRALEAGASFRHQTVTEPPAGFDWTIDATGRRRTLGRRWTRYTGHPWLRNAAVGRHVPAGLLPPGAQQGDITIYAIEGAWFWVIPLGDSLTSVGLVTTPARRGLKWEHALQQCPELEQLLAAAPPASPLSGHQDFTEYAAAFCGDGWALVGDAAMFLDPVFSSGVLFSLEGAERLSRVIEGTLSPAAYESEMRAAAALIEPLILGFYSGDFFELSFLDESLHEPLLRAGVVSLLAGDIFDGGARMGTVVSRRLPDLVKRVRRDIPVE